MPLDLPAGLVIGLNVLGWPAIQVTIAWAILRCPASWFEAQSVVDPYGRPFERFVYGRVLVVRRWKAFIPDAASWFQRGIPKTLPRRGDRASLTRLVTETRRAEVAHWLMIIPTPVFFLWNPVWADAVMIAYASIANVPCIIVQRSVRERLQAALRRSGEPASVRTV